MISFSMWLWLCNLYFTEMWILWFTIDNYKLDHFLKFTLWFMLGKTPPLSIYKVQLWWSLLIWQICIATIKAINSRHLMQPVKSIHIVFAAPLSVEAVGRDRLFRHTQADCGMYNNHTHFATMHLSTLNVCAIGPFRPSHRPQLFQNGLRDP